MQKTIAEYFKTQPVLKAWLFGSFARGEETPSSDVDILVLLDKCSPQEPYSDSLSDKTTRLRHKRNKQDNRIKQRRD